MRNYHRRRKHDQEVSEIEIIPHLTNTQLIQKLYNINILLFKKLAIMITVIIGS